MIRKLLFCVSIIAAALLHVSASSAGDDAVLAKIGDKKITVAEFERFISSFPPDKQKLLVENPKNNETLLRRIVQVKALSDIARSRGLDKDERVRQQIDYYADEILAQEFLRQEVAKINITEEDVKTYYIANEKSFKFPEMVKARHILIKADKSASEEEKKKARGKAEDLLKKIRAGEDFAKLAAEFSDDPGSKAKGGELGFFGRGKMVKPFEEAAFSLNPGEVSGVVETTFGFHIIKVEEKKEAGVEPFETAKEKVRLKLVDEVTRERTKDVIDNALKNAKVEMHSELLTGVKK